jgi:hypothetical protein
VTERKFAVLRCVIEGKDTLLVQDVEVQDSQALRQLKREVEKRVKLQYPFNGTLSWVGWVDAWQLLSGPIQLK